MENVNNNFGTMDSSTASNNSSDVNTPARVLTATSIIGDNVENSTGDKLGEIKDIMLNVQNGNIEYVILKYGGFLGLGEKLFAVPFTSLQLDSYNQVFILNKDADYLKNSPGFDKDHWPETNSHYYNDANLYWDNYEPRDRAFGNAASSYNNTGSRSSTHSNTHTNTPTTDAPFIR